MWIKPTLPFEMRFMCSAYHWTNSKLAIVSSVTMPCQTQTIGLSLLSSNHHHLDHHQHYVSFYEHEMYHLCQYEYDTSSANCKHKNINMLKDCCTIGYIQCLEKSPPISSAIIPQRPISFIWYFTHTNYGTYQQELSYRELTARTHRLPCRQNWENWKTKFATRWKMCWAVHSDNRVLLLSTVYRWMQ